MHENIKKIFEHSRTVVIDAIKQFVKSQPDKVFSLDDEQYSMFDSNNGCVMTYFPNVLYINENDDLICQLRFGYGITPQDTQSEDIPIECMTMDEIYKIIERIK